MTDGSCLHSCLGGIWMHNSGDATNKQTDSQEFFILLLPSPLQMLFIIPDMAGYFRRGELDWFIIDGSCVGTGVAWWSGDGGIWVCVGGDCSVLSVSLVEHGWGNAVMSPVVSREPSASSRRHLLTTQQHAPLAASLTDNPSGEKSLSWQPFVWCLF